MKKWYLFVAIALVVSFNSCKKDDPAPEIQATHMKLMDNLDKLGIPDVMKNSSNYYAEMAVGCYDQVMGVEGYFSWFDLPEDAEHDGDNYYWSYGGLSLWEVYSETGSDYVWDIYIKTDETSKLKYFHSEESKDGKTGKMEVFNYLSETNELLFSYNWSFDSAGNMTMTENYGDGSYKYEIISNIDRSGSAKTYINGELYTSFLWNKDGSGSYKVFDENGGVISSETWTAADL